MKKFIVLLASCTVINANATSSTQSILLDNNIQDSWKGVYFGAAFGAGYGDVSTSVNRNETTISVQSPPPNIQTSSQNTSGKINGHSSGSIASLFVGYNFHPSATRFVFGGQIEGAMSDISLSASGFTNTVANSTNGATQSFSQGQSLSNYEDKLRSMFSLVGRAGFLSTANILIYGLGGITEGHFVMPNTGDITANQPNQWKLGYTLGAGLEYTFNNHWSIRGEYRYLHFNLTRSLTAPSSSQGINGAAISTFNSTFQNRFNTDFNNNLVNISIVWRV